MFTCIVKEPGQDVLVQGLSLMPAFSAAPLIVNSQAQGGPPLEDHLHSLLECGLKLGWQLPNRAANKTAIPQFHKAGWCRAVSGCKIQDLL